MSSLETLGDSVKVLVRVRPLNNNEQSDPVNAEAAVHITSANSLAVSSVDQKKSFQCAFDHVLGPFASQAQVYDKVKECTMSVMNGINATIFAYGQTGSGKTHSMYGPPNYINTHGRETDQLGVIPRAINHIFEMARNPAVLGFQVHCSFVQIYNENLYDMLRDPAMNIPLTIREDKNEIYVQGLSEYNVKTVSDTLQLLKVAEDNRAIRETHMNQFSSRSHSIFQIFVEFKRMSSDDDATGEVSYRAKFNLVDLAGSEKWDLRRDMREEHIAEMTNINLSLHTLGKCISALAKASRKRNKEAAASSGAGTAGLGLDRSYSEADLRSSTDSPFNMSLRSKPGTASAAVHVPFRESKLTRLLQDSLGGSARTFLIATVSPAKVNAEESISTLKFADRAKQVMVQTVINESRPVDYAVVKKLQQELEMLKTLIRRVLGAAGHDRVHALMHAPDGLSELERGFLVKELQDSGGASGLGVGVAFGGGGLPPAFSASPQRGVGKEHFGTQQQQQQQQSASVGSGVGVLGLVNRSMNTLPARLHPDELEGGGHPMSGSQNVETGSGLEYVISLEKALNKEQVHAQHLTKKNETLIKELEELKMTNMQLSFGQSGQAKGPSLPGQGQDGGSGGVAVNMSGARGSFSIPESEVQQVMSSVKLLMKQNEDLVQSTDQIQKVMKRFFKFQIEEEDMKAEITKIFDAMKEVKAQAAATKVNDNFAFLEFSAKASHTHGPAVSQLKGAPTVPTAASQASTVTQSNLSPPNKAAAAKSKGRTAEAQVPKATRNLPSLPQPQALVQHTNAAQPRQGSAERYSDDMQSHSTHYDQFLHSPPRMDAAQTTADAPHTGGISFRVRAGPGTNSSQDQWAAPLPDAMDEEERLRQELKKAKKKIKQQEKLQLWMKEKEDKALAEQKAQLDEAKAMQEAELQREAKRREYAQKQRAKLANYQDRVKSETEKIQELINLGIDPKSLNL